MGQKTSGTQKKVTIAPRSSKAKKIQRTPLSPIDPLYVLWSFCDHQLKPIPDMIAPSFPTAAQKP